MARYRGPDGREVSKSFLLKRDADNWVSAQVVAVNSGQWVPQKKQRTTVAEVYPVWFATKQHLEETTISHWQGVYNSQIQPMWGSKRITTIRKKDIQAWVNDLASRDKPLSSSRITHCLQALSGIMEAAIDEKVITVNPCRGVRKKTPRAGKVRALSPEEVSQLVEALPTHWRVYVRVLVGTGLRMSELSGLQVHHVDLTLGSETLVIERALVEKSGSGLIEKDTKTHLARTIPIPPFLLPVFMEAVEGKKRYAPVFEGPNASGVIRGSSLRPALKRATMRKRVEGEEGYTQLIPRLGVVKPKDLRSTFASIAIANGGDVVSVSKWLGHADPSITLRRYSAFFQQNLDLLASRTSGIWDGIPSMSVLF